MSTVSPLLAGAAMADITPGMGIQICGDIGRYRPVEEVREPLYARALVLEQDGRRCCILSLDICAVMPSYIERIRTEAASRFGLAPEGIMIHPLQNHAAPCLGHIMLSDEYPLPDDLWFLRGGDDRYNDGAVEGILTAVGDACASLRPVKVKAGRSMDGRVAFNRRFVMRDGTARTHPPKCDPNILYCEGPIDPEVSVTTFTDEQGDVVAALLHHTCHPVHGYPLRYISWGWPGAWADGVRQLLGDQCVPLVINGACGNIHHNNHLDPDQVDDYVEMGRKLTETAQRILSTLEPVDAPSLDRASRSIRLPLRELEQQEVSKAQKLLNDHPDPIWKDETRTAVHWDWVYAIATMDLKANSDKQPYYDYEIQLIRIGELAVLALVGEPFVEAQLEIKLHSPAKYSMVAHMSNGYIGYIPTRQALARGGYETWTANWSKLAPEALECISAESISMLQELFAAKQEARCNRP